MVISGGRAVPKLLGGRSKGCRSGGALRALRGRLRGRDNLPLTMLLHVVLALALTKLGTPAGVFLFGIPALALLTLALDLLEQDTLPRRRGGVAIVLRERGPGSHDHESQGEPAEPQREATHECVRWPSCQRIMFRPRRFAS